MSVTLNGTDQWLSATGIGSNYYGYPFSVSYWVKVASQQSGCPLSWNRTNSVLREFTFELRADPLIRLAIGGNAAAQFLEHSVSYATGTWFNVIFVVTSQDDATIYYNGTGSSTTGDPTDAGGDFVNIDELNIGRIGDSSPSNELDGKVAEVAIWSTSLTTQNVTDLQTKKPSEVASGARVNYWPLETDANDSWGALNLTNNGSATISAADHPSLTGGGGSTDRAGPRPLIVRGSSPAFFAANQLR